MSPSVKYGLSFTSICLLTNVKVKNKREQNLNFFLAYSFKVQSIQKEMIFLKGLMIHFLGTITTLVEKTVDVLQEAIYVDKEKITT